MLILRLQLRDPGLPTDLRMQFKQVICSVSHDHILVFVQNDYLWNHFKVILLTNLSKTFLAFFEFLRCLNFGKFHLLNEKRVLIFLW